MALVNGATYRFLNRATEKEENGLGRSLNVYGNSPSYLANVCLFKSNDGDVCQQWIYKESGGHKYLICKGAPSLVLDLFTGSSAAANVTNYNAHVFNQLSNTCYLEIEPLSGNDSGYIRIRLANYTNKYLTANQGSNGTNTGKDVNAPGNVYFYNGGLTDYSQDWKPIRLDAVDPDPDPDPSDDDQYLIMPINQSNITVSYKDNAPAYHEQFPSAPTHYAIDMYGTPRDFYASGTGRVVGYSKTNAGPLGRWLAVRYDNVINVNGKRIGSVILRYCHLDDIYKTSGYVHIDDEEPMARYGNSGTTNAHLHVEVDTNVNAPNETPTLSGASNGLKPASNDTTIDPFSVFHRKLSKPEEQTVTPQQSYCNIPNCQTCATLYPQYEEGKVPYVNVAQCKAVPIYPEQ